MDFFNKKKLNNLQLQVKALQSAVSTQMYSNWLTKIYPEWKSYKEMQTYSTMDDIYSVISYCAEKIAGIPLYAYEVTNDKKALKLKNTNPLNQLKHRYYQTKALQDLEAGDRFYDFFESPFYGWSKYDGIYLIACYLLSAGEAFLYKDAEIRLGVNSTVDYMHILAPENMTVVTNGGFPKTVTGYEYEINGKRFTLDVNDVIHIKEPKLGVDNERGQSKIKALAQRLTRLQAGMDSSVAQIQNGGMPGILFNKNDDGSMVHGQEITVSDMHKENFSRFLRNSNNKGAPYWMGGEVGYIPIGLKLTDMEVAELANVDFKKICNAFHISDILFNSDSAATESNVQEQRKAAYTDCFLPTMMRIRDALNNSLLPEFRDKKRQLQEDISDIPVLQEDMEAQARALSQMWWVTPNEKREIQRFDKSDDNMLDEFIIPSGMMILSDLLPPLPDLSITEDYKPKKEPQLNGNGKY